MIITGMAHFESVAQKKLVEWYHKNRPEVQIENTCAIEYGIPVIEDYTAE